MIDYTRPEAICVGCGKRPVELREYSPDSTGADMSAEDYVWLEEGTLNPHNGHFTCTPCYVKAGMPSAPGGWRAP